MNQVVTTESREIETIPGENLEDFVTFIIKGQLFGIPVLKVQDILTPDNIAAIPLAPPEVKGSINLRGRIVTVVDVRVRLGLGKKELDRPSLKAVEKDPEPEQDAKEAGEESKQEQEAPAKAPPDEGMGVTVEHENELYTLLVDKVGDVIGLSKDFYESNPSTLDPVWREFASGVYRLDGQLMVVLDVERLLNISSKA